MYVNDELDNIPNYKEFTGFYKFINLENMIFNIRKLQGSDSILEIGPEEYIELYRCSELTNDPSEINQSSVEPSTTPKKQMIWSDSIRMVFLLTYRFLHYIIPISDKLVSASNNQVGHHKLLARYTSQTDHRTSECVRLRVLQRQLY